jgi:hypothetical protein
MAGHTLMLPLAEGFHVMEKSAKENGLSPFEFENLMKGLEVAAISGATGIKTKEVKDDVEEPADLEKVLNYRQKGRPITPEERKTFENRTEEIFKLLQEQNDKLGVLMIGDKNLPILKAAKKGATDTLGNPLPVMTKDEKYKELNRLRQQASDFAKQDLFGVEKPSVPKELGKTRLEIERDKRKRLLKLKISEKEEEFLDPDFLIHQQSGKVQEPEENP